MPNLTAEQQHVVRSIVKDVKQGELQTTFGGFAGVGKTFCVATLSEVFGDFAVAAYTGKAASILRGKGLQASTIHSLIYKPEVYNGKIEFILKEPHELSCRGFLIDEASMISKVVNDDLLSFGLPIVYVGDHGQLEPIGQDIGVMANPKYRLETIHRNAGEIAYFAEHIRKGRLARTFQSQDKVIFVEPREVTDEMMLSSDQMICAFNKTRVAKNAIVRELLGRKKLVEVGDRVMCLRNNKRRLLFNGMQGEVIKAHKKYPRMDFKSDGVIYSDIQYDPNQFGKEKNQFEFGMDSPEPFDYAYTCTTHKFQGSEADNVLVFEQNCDKWDMRRHSYTSASRAKQFLIWVSEKRHVPKWLTSLD